MDDGDRTSDRLARKNLLAQLAFPDEKGAIRYSDHVIGNGPEFFKQASDLGMEVIVSKLRDRPYTAGRNPDWLKVKAAHREEFVIGGFTNPGVRGGFGALFLRYHDKKHQLHYAGKVGTGFTDALLAKLRERLDRLVQKQSPFADLKRTVGDARGAHWVKPQLVGQIAFTEWTRGDHLRHPSFLGLREDKPASAVVRDHAASVAAAHEASKAPRGQRKFTAVPEDRFHRTAGKTDEGELTGVRITNPEKVLFPDGDVTKLELAQYYLSVERWIMPQIANRPLFLRRCPAGATGHCFFQKHPHAGAPETIRRVPVKESGGTRPYLVVDKIEDLIALAQIGALEIHVWGSQADQLEFPDRMFFDPGA